jgi:HAD superfamily hydrolase (TIGR01484 family)
MIFSMPAGCLMPDRLLICTDLDRTLIPNGPQPESPKARQYFSALTSRPEVELAYVTGRHQKLVQDAITHYCLPLPDFVIGDVGSTIYQVENARTWIRQIEWETSIARDWAGHSHADLKSMLSDIHALRPQESAKQNHFKLSFYVPLQANRQALTALIEQRFADSAIKASLIWSVDEPAGIGLLDILPASASKFHAIEALMKMHGYTLDNTVFSGDSGNDIEVLASPVSSILVANCQPDVKELATLLANENGYPDQLYLAKGNFAGMNGNYSAGILEGVVHYFPYTRDWILNEQANQAS